MALAHTTRLDIRYLAAIGIPGTASITRENGSDGILRMVAEPLGVLGPPTEISPGGEMQGLPITNPKPPCICDEINPTESRDALLLASGRHPCIGLS